MKRGLFFSIIFTACFGVMAQSNYKVDPAHASVNFKVKHNGITFVQGRFDQFDGAIIGSPGQLESARVFFNVEVESINTGIPMRDDHLRSADFFEVERFPIMSFESTGIEKVEDNNYKLHGKLQIKDVAKDVTFDVVYGGAVKGEDGTEVVGFTAKHQINRLDYNIAFDPDGAAIGKEVFITLFLEFKSN
ncbi:YceI family protein [Proteiniphilum sp. X52]|uniref:YceI family protein n=1 Tax=Proteiniphilum sp. X52 TaxID=2382159 RepID=UPI000F09B75D|nr:YceI family protein [Proteiniphilum sp. X52]RNC65347.1 polyisoprenoid-binding protein [Proteiniphilum sp. X52]